MKDESALLVQDKDIVVPGDVLAQGMEFLPSHGTYRRNEQILANQTGLLTIEGKVLKIIPLAGVYTPKRYDVVVGRVMDILMSGWRMEINCPYSAVLMMKDATFDYIKKGADLTQFFDLDDWVACKIVQVTSQNLIDVSMKGPGLQKLVGGRVIRVNAAKVPRIVGKRASMINMVKQATGCKIVVGQNGLVWLKGDPEQEVLAIDTIRKIEREAHVPGLTERIKLGLEQATGKEIDSNMYDEEPRDERPPRREGDRRGPPRRGGDRGRRRGPPRHDR